MKIETGRGVLTLSLQATNGKVEQVTVNMGQPILEFKDIPVDPSLLTPTEHPHEWQLYFGDDTVPEERLSRLLDETAPPVDATFVSMGNPHAVIFVPDVESPNLNYLVPLIEDHLAFPRRINVHWAQVITKDEIIMRTWERGSGITLACGTGACAVCVAGVLTGRTNRKLLAHLPGGNLTLEWREADNNVYMTGPATEVFEGEWNG